VRAPGWVPPGPGCCPATPADVTASSETNFSSGVFSLFYLLSPTTQNSSPHQVKYFLKSLSLLSVPLHLLNSSARVFCSFPRLPQLPTVDATWQGWSTCCISVQWERW